MGGLAAVVNWDGRLVVPAEIDAIASASGFRAPDGIGTACDGPAALAHLRFTTTDHDNPGQPLLDPERDLCFVFDGRLDNRDELLPELELSDGSSDARIALEAVARWGEAAPARLLGAFAFVAWRRRARQVLCARDHLGARPLHYFVAARLMVVGTDPAQVLAHPAVPLEPCPTVAAGYLAGELPDDGRTFYRDIRRLPPGHTLVATPSGVRLRCYWRPEPGEPLRYRDNQDYAAHCRELLVRAVRAALRTDRPAGALLSGGLDSSSVVVTSHRLAEGRAPRPFSMIFPGHPAADERRYIHAVLRACGAEGVQVAPASLTRAGVEGVRTRQWDLPRELIEDVSCGLWRAASAGGYRVMLTGAGGDSLFGGSPFHCADLLRSGHLLGAVRVLRERSPTPRTRTAFVREFLHVGLWPNLPDPLKAALRPLARRVGPAPADPAWLAIRREQSRRPPVARGTSHAAAHAAQNLASGMHAHYLECHERAAALAGLEIRHALLDRRLVEFALRLPDEQRWQGAFTKIVLRRALAGHLPEEVATRTGKAHFAHVHLGAMEAFGGEDFFGDLRIAEAGWVHAGLLREAYRRVRALYAHGDPAYGAELADLAGVLALELWVRSACGPRDRTPLKP